MSFVGRSGLHGKLLVGWWYVGCADRVLKHDTLKCMALTFIGVVARARGSFLIDNGSSCPEGYGCCDDPASSVDDGSTLNRSSRAAIRHMRVATLYSCTENSVQSMYSQSSRIVDYCFHYSRVETAVGCIGWTKVHARQFKLVADHSSTFGARHMP
jgi:hypothetical protein